MARKWLQQAIETDYLPSIKVLEDTPAGRQQAEGLNQRIRQEWHERGSKALSQQQGLMDHTRRVIKDELGTDHWVLDYIRFTTEEYTEINNLKQNRVAERNEATQQLDNPDAIVAQAVRLLNSPAWENIAAGIAVLTGRRVAEVLSTAQFEKKTRWSVIFTGALKRGGEEQILSFEIPTLTTADRVINALARLRAELPEAIAMEPREINKKYEQAVARACDQAFAQLVPTREGKDSLYTHLFRAVYAAIATFWYCPPSVNETEFKAAIQGHYAIRDAKNPQLRRSLAASRHYSDYEISDQEVANYNGRRKGIKLGVGGIEPIEQFKEAMEKAMEPKPQGERKGRASYRIWQDDKRRLDHLLERFEGTQQERMHAFLDWFEAHQDVLTQSPLEPTQAERTLIEVEAETQEDIPTHTQVVEAQSELDQPSGNITSPANGSSPQSSKIDELLEVMKQVMELQKASLSASLSTQAQVVQPTNPRRGRKSQPAQADKGESNARDEVDEVTRSPRIRTGVEETTDWINRAIDAIIAYNNAPDRRHAEKWAIGINTLKAFVKSQEAIVAVIGGKNRKKEEVSGSRQEEIQHHHQTHQIDPDKHNYVHRGKTKIEDVIKLH